MRADYSSWYDSARLQGARGRAPIMPEDPAPYARSGQVLLGKYRIERVLGAGGMGVVVSAHHLQLQELVALKFMNPAASADAAAVARFMREARAAARIKNEHVARVYDMGTLEEGTLYLVMEYLEGHDLDQELEARGRLPVPEVIDLLLQACEGLADAHALGIVHRDLKPANLFLCRWKTRVTAAPVVKVLDFGISKLMNTAEEPSVTRTHTVLGSPLYMSPEQLRRPRDVDARTDIWALGAVLYQLVSGAPPFQGETLSDISVKIATEPLRPLSDLVDVPPALDAIVARCLEKDRARRYPNVTALALDLVELGSKSARASLDRILSVHEPSSLPPAPAADSLLRGGVAAGRLDETARRDRASATLTASTGVTPPEQARPPRSLTRLAAASVLFLLFAGAVSALIGMKGEGASATTASSSAAPQAPIDHEPSAPSARSSSVPRPDVVPGLDTQTHQARAGLEDHAISAPSLLGGAAKPSRVSKANRPAGGAASAPHPSPAAAPPSLARDAVKSATTAAPSGSTRVFDTRKL